MHSKVAVGSHSGLRNLEVKALKTGRLLCLVSSHFRRKQDYGAVASKLQGCVNYRRKHSTLSEYQADVLLARNVSDTTGLIVNLTPHSDVVRVMW
jgi:hypothetical protein